MEYYEWMTPCGADFWSGVLEVSEDARKALTAGLPARSLLGSLPLRVEVTPAQSAVDSLAEGIDLGGVDSLGNPDGFVMTSGGVWEVMQEWGVSEVEAFPLELVGDLASSLSGAWFLLNPCRHVDCVNGEDSRRVASRQAGDEERKRWTTLVQHLHVSSAGSVEDCDLLVRPTACPWAVLVADDLAHALIEEAFELQLDPLLGTAD